MQCTAKAKSTGEQCRRRAVAGKTKCVVHGGKTPGGIASPHFKHGRYSKYLPDRLLGRYQEALADPELLSLRDDVALVDGRLTELFEQLDTGRSEALWEELQEAYRELTRAIGTQDTTRLRAQLTRLGDLLDQGASDHVLWQEIVELQEHKRRLGESERDRLVKMQQMITVERTMALLAAVASEIKRHVSDPNVLAAISAGIRGLVAGNAGAEIDGDG
jgi:hypothetical protein